MTRSGTAYQLAPLAPLTAGTASGLLRTPAATEYGSSQNGINGKGGRFERPSAGTPSLSTMARKGLWPTPQAGDGMGSRNEMGAVQRALEQGANPETLRTLTRPSGAKAALSLATAAKMWPTPTASTGGDGQRPDGFRRLLGPEVKRREAEREMWPTPKSSPSGPDYARAGRKGSGGDDLATAVAREALPTPTVSDSKGPTPNLHREGSPNLAERVTAERHGGQLNPTWVEWLMGFPPGWTDLEASATRSSRRSPSGSDSGS